MHVDDCPRCGASHHSLTFNRLGTPSRPLRSASSRPYTHWSFCPSTREPMMYAPGVQYVEQLAQQFKQIA